MDEDSIIYKEDVVMPRNLPNDPNRWRDVLECAMEHIGIVQGKLADVGILEYKDPNNPTTPPNVINNPGSIGYHFAAAVSYICEAYWAVQKYYPEDSNENEINKL